MAYNTNPSAKDLKYEDLEKISDIAYDISDLAHNLGETFYWDNYADYTAEDLYADFYAMRNLCLQGIKLIDKLVK